MGFRKTHGMTHTRIHVIWNSMRCRCERPQTHGYERYGGRGIKVCDEWKEFVPFMEWAYSHGYSDDLTLDRIDNNKGYSPDNCRWATKEEQCNNQRTNRFLTFNGETHTIMQWSRITGLSRSIITNRINSGVPVEVALTTPKANLERPVIATDLKTGKSYWFKSTKEAERQGHTRSAIWRVLTGEYKHHHGMTWEYAESRVE